MADQQEQQDQEGPRYPWAGTPQAPTTPPGALEDIKSQWADYMGQPGARAALLNFGINLMQPPSFGDTPASQIGRALGAGAEAATRGEVVESKVAESEARSEAARARAGEAGSRSDIALQRLQAGQENVRLQQRVKLALGYNTYRSGVEARNRKTQAEYEAAKNIFPETPPPQLEKLLGPNEWIDEQQRLTGGAGIPSATGSPTTSGSYPPAPRNPKDARVGVVYDTPKGPLRWTGTGFVAP